MNQFSIVFPKLLPHQLNFFLITCFQQNSRITAFKLEPDEEPVFPILKFTDMTHYL